MTEPPGWGGRDGAPSPEVMTSVDVADYLKISVEHARILFRTNKIRHTRVGEGPRARFLARKEWVIDYLNAASVPPVLSVQPARGSRRAH